MPVITVNGMPASTNHAALVGLIGSIQAAVADVTELRLNADQVTVFFPTDLVQDDLGEELIVFVDALYEKPERTSEVKNKLAKAVAETLWKFASDHLPQCDKIEVFVRSHRPEDGLAILERDFEVF